MPYLIKTNGAKRVVEQLSQQASTGVDISAIVDALKGLTFKVEVTIKIADILSPQDDHQEPEDGPETLQNKAPRTEQAIDGDSREPVQAADTLKPMINVSQRPPEVVQTKLVTAPRGPEVLPSKPISVAPEPTVIQHAQMSRNDSQSNRGLDTPNTKPISTELIAEAEKPAPALLERKTEESSSKPDPVERKPEVGLARRVVSICPKPQKPVRAAPRYKIGEVIDSLCICVDDDMTPEKPLAYILDDNLKLVKLQDVVRSIKDELEASPEPQQVQPGLFVMAKSIEDGEWYRAIVEDSSGGSVKVFYVDWGLREALSVSDLRNVTNSKLSLSSAPACAQKILVVNTEKDKIDEFFKCEVSHKIKVVGYDDDLTLMVSL